MKEEAMWTFTDSNDLIQTVEKMKERSDRAVGDQTNLKREQAWARARSSAFAEVLELLKDYFASRPLS
jgi:hypothetical protein